MKKLVFDIETKNQFSDVHSNEPVDLDISVVSIYDYESDKYLSFLEEEFDKMWPYFEKADVLITFNGDHFDIPLLNKYYSGDLSKIRSLDLLKEVKESLGRRIKLDTLAEATLGKNKIGHGLEAIVWWREGKIQKIKDYCEEDVRITKEIYEFALNNGKLFYKENPNGSEKKEIILDTSSWEKIEEKPVANSLF